MIEFEAINDLWKITSTTAPEVQQKAAKELIERVLPERANDFEVVINSDLLKPDNKDKFIVNAN